MALDQLAATAVGAHPTNQARDNPLDILRTGCKVQSLTVSDQHATLLVSHPVIIHDQAAAATVDGIKDDPASTAKHISSLLKLTVVPFHKNILGSNPVITPGDLERGQLPERNLLENNQHASDKIVAFLRNYTYSLKSESGAEYCYYTASPNLCNLVDSTKVGEGDGHDQTEPNKRMAVDTAVSKFGDLGAFDIELISPASARQISRACPSLGHVLIQETPAIYNTIVNPYIQSIVDSGSLSWIKNVISGKKEKERLLVDHNDFIINIDTKWRSHPPPLTTPRDKWYNHPSVSDLYCLGIIKQQGITCLRDLRKDHTKMLLQLEQEGLNAIKTVYGVEMDQIRVFVHYQPQFYHFHVHFTRLENEFGCAVERAHLLGDVVQNLNSDSDYYCKRIISYKLQNGAPLQNLIANYSKQANDDAE